MTMLAATISLRNILFATDFSACSQTALPHALYLARHYGATLYTLNVVPAEICDYAQSPDPFYFRHSAEKKIKDPVSSSLLQGVKHYEMVREGPVPEIILALSERFNIDLIVLGSRGRNGIKKLILGSVAEEVVNSAACAVLTVGPHVEPRPALELKLNTILYATDLEPGSGRALAFALLLAERARAHLILLHVLKMPLYRAARYSEAARDIAIDRLAHLLPSGANALVEAEPIVEAGIPVERIVKVAEGRGADLVVMGLRHSSRPRVSTHLPWVATHQVLCELRCPGLTVRD